MLVTMVGSVPGRWILGAPIPSNPSHTPGALPPSCQVTQPLFVSTHTPAQSKEQTMVKAVKGWRCEEQITSSSRGGWQPASRRTWRPNICSQADTRHIRLWPGHGIYALSRSFANFLNQILRKRAAVDRR